MYASGFGVSLSAAASHQRPMTALVLTASSAASARQAADTLLAMGFDSRPPYPSKDSPPPPCKEKAVQ